LIHINPKHQPKKSKFSEPPFFAVHALKIWL